MSHQHILSQYEHGNWYPASTPVSTTLGKNKRLADDEGDNERPRKRRSVVHVADHAQDSTLSHQWRTDIQGNRERASILSIPPRPSNGVPANLRFDIPECGRHNVPHLVQQPPSTSYSHYPSVNSQEYGGSYPSGAPVTLSDWRSIPPPYPYDLNPPLRPLEVTRNIPQASWRSFTEYVDYSLKRDPIPPRRYTTSPTSPLFPPLGSSQDATYSEEEEDPVSFEPGTTRSMSPEPFIPRNAQDVYECMVPSPLGNNAYFHGKRRGLIIVLEYPGQTWWNGPHTMELPGPYKDGEDIFRLLREEGYRTEDITFMTDSPESPVELRPTHENIKYQLGKLVAGAKPGDRFFLFYAGHGTQVKDTNGDEADGLDEAIIPSDWATTYRYSNEGLIVDDYLKEVCVDPLPKGAYLTAVFDCCHAGTIMDLTYEHSAKKMGLDFKLNELTGLSSRRLPSRHQSVDGRVLCISACEDDQRAFTGKRGLLKRGLLTEAFTRGIRKLAKAYTLAGVTFRLNPTLKQLYEYLLQHGRPNSIEHGLKYIQDPMLATTFKMSVAEYHRPVLI